MNCLLHHIIPTCFAFHKYFVNNTIHFAPEFQLDFLEFNMRVFILELPFKERLRSARNNCTCGRKVSFILFFCLVLQCIIVLMNKLLKCGHGIYITIKKCIHAFTPLCSGHSNQKCCFRKQGTHRCRSSYKFLNQS